MKESKQNIIDSDALGKKGERRFGELCADAGLTFNASLDWDKAGWDFTIDFELDESGFSSLDHRKTPLSCRVQQKTILDSTESVCLPLKMAERLAKDAVPAFISVFKVSEHLQFTSAYLIHISGDRLASILKRLRKEGVGASSKDLNGKKISFTPMESERIELSGFALREALKKYIGNDIHAYVEKKKIEVQRIGYDDVAYTLGFSVAKKDTALLREVFLGTSAKLEINDFHYEEIRFGISHQHQAGVGGTLQFNAPVYGQCSITFLDKKALSSANFEGKFYVCPPEIGGGLRLKSDLITINFATGGDDEEMIVSFELSAEGKLCSASEWTSYWKAIQIIQSREGVVRLQLAGQSTCMELSISSMKESDIQGDMGSRVALFEMLERLRVVSGIDKNHKFFVQDCWDSSDEIEKLIYLLSDDAGTLYASVIATKEESESFNRNIIFAESVSICGVVVAYCGTADVSSEHNGDKASLTLKNLSGVRLKEVKSLQEYEHFVEKFKKEKAIDAILNGGYIQA